MVSQQPAGLAGLLKYTYCLAGVTVSGLNNEKKRKTMFYDRYYVLTQNILSSPIGKYPCNGYSTHGEHIRQFPPSLRCPSDPDTLGRRTGLIGSADRGGGGGVTLISPCRSLYSLQSTRGNRDRVFEHPVQRASKHRAKRNPFCATVRSASVRRR